MQGPQSVEEEMRVDFPAGLLQSPYEARRLY